MNNEPEWLEDVTRLWRSRHRDMAFDRLYQSVDAAFRAGEFASIDEVLRTLDLDRFDTALLLGFLTITGAARADLTERAGLYRRIRARLEKTDTGRVDALLEGLE